MRTLYRGEPRPPSEIFMHGIGAPMATSDEAKIDRDAPFFESRRPDVAFTTDINVAGFFPQINSFDDIAPLSESYIYIVALDEKVEGFHDLYRRSLTLFPATAEPSETQMNDLVKEWTKVRTARFVPPGNIQAAIKIKRHFDADGLYYDSFDMVDLIPNPDTKIPLSEDAIKQLQKTIELNQHTRQAETISILLKMKRVFDVCETSPRRTRIQLTARERLGLEVFLTALEYARGDIHTIIASYNRDRTYPSRDNLPLFDELVEIAEREHERCVSTVSKCQAAPLRLTDPSIPEAEQPYIKLLKRFLTSRTEAPGGDWSAAGEENELYMDALKSGLCN
ncbi:MAG: hypothetical protein P1U34_07115 [Coxiellaceae bacterium]|nr:hypothetical protein [Coxiellaceae bacterium]